MKMIDVFPAWLKILQGRRPFLSLEITRECPLRCPGCYAYMPEHLGSTGSLRTLGDFSGQELITRVLALVKRLRPLHISIVGGDPLVRWRELDILLPELAALGIEVQLVTSAFRPIPLKWGALSNLHLVVSIDGLRAEHAPQPRMNASSNTLQGTASPCTARSRGRCGEGPITSRSLRSFGQNGAK